MTANGCSGNGVGGSSYNGTSGYAGDPLASVEFHGELLKVKLESDDVVLLMMPTKLSDFDIQRVWGVLKKAFPYNQCLVLHGGAEIEVVSAVKAAQVEADAPQNVAARSGDGR